MKILYLITKILTYPGAYLKGFWEHCTCRILGLQVTERGYLNASATCGHVAHTPAMSPAKAFLFSWMPLIPQHILGWIFLGASVGPLLILGIRGQAESSLFLLEAVALFIGISMICNSFPQWEDAKRHWRLFYGKPTPEEEQDMQVIAEHEAAEKAAAEQTAEEVQSEVAEAIAEEATEEGAEADVLAPDEYENAIDTDQLREAALEAAAEENAAEEEAVALPVVPRFASLAGKIIFAPANVYFIAGAWLEYTGLSTILLFGASIALLVLRS